ncbi:hypothetical protein GCM10007100_08260 [Roseibacillus persicicus]|uniref:Thioredoxin domain-containing protein n=1 Tax=Roseibacillus persicicus TaxID=454148 RepID=A0A918TEU5_9BACT|nr:hypothetical protein GCM10007100_08260 [Roseibacillus persicicus]
MGKLASQGQPGVQYAKVDLGKNPQMGQEYGVRSIPDTRIFHNGKQIGKFVGSCSEKVLKNMVTNYLSSVRPVETAPSEPSSNLPEEGQEAPVAAPVVPAIRPAVQNDGLPPGIQRIPAP